MHSKNIIKEGWLVFSNMMDYKDAMARKLSHDDKIDPGTFSIMEPGWWALHATAIAGVYLLGNKMRKRF
ncbi:MAG: hypothetical protein CVU90_06095 [Firmicutes bacterium HGW-Firmicutes-15]|nr:MAG: hypothetical protein CVU90_06095 [Firmicutes bacterium HGW-Firmicutes-15]